jgi:hypothetical protein
VCYHHSRRIDKITPLFPTKNKKRKKKKKNFTITQESSSLGSRFTFKVNQGNLMLFILRIANVKTLISFFVSYFQLETRKAYTLSSNSLILPQNKKNSLTIINSSISTCIMQWAYNMPFTCLFRGLKSNVLDDNIVRGRCFGDLCMIY